MRSYVKKLLKCKYYIWIYTLMSTAVALNYPYFTQLILLNLRARNVKLKLDNWNIILKLTALKI